MRRLGLGFAKVRTTQAGAGIGIPGPVVPSVIPAASRHRQEVAHGEDARVFVAAERQEVALVAGEEEVGPARLRDGEGVVVVGIGAEGDGRKAAHHHRHVAQPVDEPPGLRRGEALAQLRIARGARQFGDLVGCGQQVESPLLPQGKGVGRERPVRQQRADEEVRVHDQPHGYSASGTRPSRTAAGRASGAAPAVPHEAGKPERQPVWYDRPMTGANPECGAAAVEAANRVVVDLFSCGGGMSAGFAGRTGWRLAAAVDLEVAKPSGKASGETGCNAIYEANHGLRPISADLATMEPAALLQATGLRRGETGCLISCAPCTDFSRANPDNHMADRDRNTLVGRSGHFATALDPGTFVMENARELITGNHPQHFRRLRERLVGSGYDVRADVHFLSRFGLPQVRERALLMASRVGPARTLEDLWEGWEVAPEIVTVRSALSRLDGWLAEHPDDPDGSAVPGMRGDVLARLAATPGDGGGWVDVARDPDTRHLCTPDCLRRWEIRDLGSHPDVYGRMWWNRPAPTIKRECAHVGNGRYAHPERNRLLTVREMATLQGFPFTYRFPSKSVANRYRAIGDAVPPLVAWQIAACVEWAVTGRKPDPAEWVMPGTCLRLSDLRRVAGAPVTVRRAA